MDAPLPDSIVDGCANAITPLMLFANFGYN